MRERRHSKTIAAESTGKLKDVGGASTMTRSAMHRRERFLADTFTRTEGTFSPIQALGTGGLT